MMSSRFMLLGSALFGTPLLGTTLLGSTLFWSTPAAASTPLGSWDLEADDGGFVSAGDTRQWEWAAVREGPGGGHYGDNAWSTGIDGSYLNDSVDTLTLALPDLSGTVSPALRFWSWYQIGQGDAGWVEVERGAGWSRVTPFGGYPDEAGFTGDSDGWEQVTVDLDPSVTAVRWVFSTDVSGVGAGWTIDDVELADGDLSPPVISSLPVMPDTEDTIGPYVVTASITDDRGVVTADLFWSDGSEEGTTPMLDVGGGFYLGEIPGHAAGTDITWWVQAEDGENVAASEKRSFRVYLAAPENLDGPDGRYVGTSAVLTWDPPDSAYEPLYYQVFRGGVPDVSSASTSAETPLEGVDDCFTVRAIFEAGLGDPSNEVCIAAAVPEIVSVEPGVAWPGDAIRVTVTGRYLLLTEGEVGAWLGAGITVEAVEVQDVDVVRLQLSVDEDAAEGSRDLSLDCPVGTLTAEAVFRVEDAADRPRLASIDPSEVTQGETGQLSITYVGELEAVPTVDLGDGIVVENVFVATGNELRVTYAVEPRAALGERVVQADDGVRRYGGVSLVVEDHGYIAEKSCGTGRAPSGLAALLGLLVLRRRRGCRG